MDSETVSTAQQISGERPPWREAKDDNHYLRSLVRMDIRKNERGLAKLKQRPDQTDEEFGVFKAHLEAKLAYRREVLVRLEEAREEWRSET